MEKKFTLSATDKKLAGVCGGIAAYTGLSSTIVRALFVLFTIVVGGGLLLYIILWLLAPKA